MGSTICCQPVVAGQSVPLEPDQEPSRFDSPAHLPYDKALAIPFSERDTHVSTLLEDFTPNKDKKLEEIEKLLPPAEDHLENYMFSSCDNTEMMEFTDNRNEFERKLEFTKAGIVNHID